MAIPDYQTLMRPVLVSLQTGESKRLSALVDELSDQFQLNEEERLRRIPSGGSTYISGRVGWARTYLKQAGLVSAPQRGYIEITDLGQKAIKDCPERIDNNYLNQFESFREFKQTSQGTTSQTKKAKELPQAADEQLDPQERLEEAHAEIERNLVSDVLQNIKNQSPQFFEQLVIDLMLAMGYGGWSTEAGQTTQYSADGGVDGIINEDPLGLETIYLQAKRYKENKVGRPDIQSFVGALEMKRARKGVFITASSFSHEATEYVSMIDKKVVLIDGQQLAKYMIQYNLGVTVKESYDIKMIDSDYFLDD